MKNNIQLFKNEEFGEVRSLVINNEPWFVGKDVAEILGYKNVSDALSKHVEEEDKLTSQFTISGQGRNMIIINESGLYSLILKSKLSSAKKFKRWVTSEVLPTIRKHGAYATDEVIDEIISNPEFGIKLLSELKEEREKRKQLESDNSKLSIENRLLQGETFSWANRNLINALVRLYGSKTTGFGDAWVEFKKNILYKYSININSRITNYRNKTGKKTKPKTLEMLHDDEISDAIKTILTMCKDINIDTSEIIKHQLEKNVA